MNTRFRQAGVQRGVVEVTLAPRSAQGSVQRPPCKGLSSCGGRLRKPCLLQGTEDAHTWFWPEVSPDVKSSRPRRPLSRALSPPNERPLSSAGPAHSISRRHTRIIVQVTGRGNRGPLVGLWAELSGVGAHLPIGGSTLGSSLRCITNLNRAKVSGTAEPVSPTPLTCGWVCAIMAGK